MLTDFWFNLKLGLFHVLDWNAYDHVLFLIALVATCTFSQYKKVFYLVSVFTIGHTISLCLAAYDILTIKSEIIEFLIPVSILFTAVYNILWYKNNKTSNPLYLLYFFTLFFGLVHGFGFSSYFNMISQSTDNKLLMLVEFALGVELSQLIVVLFVLLLASILHTFLKVSRRDWVLIASSIVIGLCIPILRETWIL
jgi:hypothetical protein